MSSFTEKYTAGSYTVDTTHAKCPNHLYLIDEGSGTTLTDRGKTGGLNLTITNATWSTDDLTAGGGTSPVLVLDGTGDYARSGTGFSFSGSTTGTPAPPASALLVAIFKTTDATPPGSNETLVALGNSANNTDFVELRLNATTGYANATYDDSAVSPGAKTGSVSMYDQVWHMVACRQYQNNSTDIKSGLSIDGAPFTTGTVTSGTNGLWNMNRIAIGDRAGSALGTDFKGKLAAVFVYKDTNAPGTDWNDTFIASLFSNPWQFINAASAPAFTVPATVSSQTSTVYTLSFTPDSSCTIYAVAVIAGSTAPSIAQVKAGQNGSGGTAKASNSKAVTGADTLTLTPSDSPAFPRYDIYCVLSNASGDSALRTLASEYLDAPTGKTFTTLTSVDSTSPFSGTGAAISDTAVLDSVTTPSSYAVTGAVDGTVSYAAGGDTSRQLVAANVYDYSAGAYLGAGTLVFNNLAPAPSGEAFAEPLLYQKSVAIDTLGLAALAPDPEGDTVTVTALDALPTGLSIASSNLSGTPSAYGETVVTLQWEDIYGATYTEDVTIQIGELVPNVVNFLQATAESTIDAVASLTTNIATQSSATVASGYVISTYPEAATLVPYDEAITLFVSSGSALTITTTSLTNGTRDTAYAASLAANGAVTTWSVDAGNLPTGLTLDNASGVISGTPTVAGVYSFTIGATNGAASDTQALSLTIAGIAPSISTTTLTRAIQDVPYSAQIAATGDATITYAVTAGLLPDGLSLSSSGLLSGTPTEVGGSAFTVTATNAEGSDTQALGLSVVDPDTDYVFTLRPRRNRIRLRRQ